MGTLTAAGLQACEARARDCFTRSAAACDRPSAALYIAHVWDSCSAPAALVVTSYAISEASVCEATISGGSGVIPQPRGARCKPTRSTSAPTFVAEVVELDEFSRQMRTKGMVSEADLKQEEEEDSDHGSVAGEDSSALDGVTLLVRTLDRLLGESTMGCKSWTAITTSGSAGSHDSGQDAAKSLLNCAEVGKGRALRFASANDAALLSRRECSMVAGSEASSCAVSHKGGTGWTSGAKRDWWRWRKQLDERCGEVALELQGLVGGTLRAVLPIANQVSSGSSAGGNCYGNKSCRAGNVVGNTLVLLLDADLHRLPWEWLEVLRSRSVFRVLHLGCLQPHRFAGSVCGQVQLVNTEKAVFVVDPKGDLPGTQNRFEGWFCREPGWCGSAGTPPMPTEQLRQELQQKDLFVFLGHGAGVLPHVARWWWLRAQDQQETYGLGETSQPPA
jgi:hypothetical protein